MANELLESYRTASSLYRHVVFNDRTQQFERAGKRHAIATFFGFPDVTAKNAATLDAIKRFMEVEREQEYGGAGTDGTKDYFSGIKSSRRIKSATIDRIIARIRNDMAAMPGVQNAVKDRLVREYLEEPENYGFLDLCAGTGGNSRDMAEKIARLLVDGLLRKNPVSGSLGLEDFRLEARRSLDICMNRLGAFLLHNHADAEDFGDLFAKFGGCDAGIAADGGCRGRFLTAFLSVVGQSEGGGGDEIALSRFLSFFEGEKGQDIVKSGRFSGEELAAAFGDVSGNGSLTSTSRMFAAFELKLTAGGMFGDFGRAGVLEGLSAVFPEVREEDADCFLSVMADILGHDASVGDSAGSVEACARKVNETIRFLRTRTELHPDAFDDGVRLMQDLHAPVGPSDMESLLEMAKKITDGILDSERPFAETVDRDFASACFAGNGIASAVGKDEKNWIVAKFVLASASKVRYRQAPGKTVCGESPQHDCARRVLSSFRNLQALYDRVGGPLCAKYSRALEFLVGQYWASGLCDRYGPDEANVCKVSKELLEKYEVSVRTGVKPGDFRTGFPDYREFDGCPKTRMAEAAATIDRIVGAGKILSGDKVRARQLIMQELAFLCRDGGFPDDDQVRDIANRYCRMAKWGGALLDRLEKEVPASRRKAVVLAMEAYDCSSDAKLFDMLTEDEKTLGFVDAYVGKCAMLDALADLPEGTSVKACDIHLILTGRPGVAEDLDPARNPHLSVIYSRQP